MGGRSIGAINRKGGGFIRLLEIVGDLIPGERLKTSVYLKCIAGPRKLMRRSIGAFYRMDHIYDVCREFGQNYSGKFSILEFGVADGYAYTKKLYATRYLGLEDRIMVHGFDTFEGLPPPVDPADEGLVKGTDWSQGHYRGNLEELQRYCDAKYRNFRLHKGLFEDTLTDEVLSSLDEYKPILIWIDCDYYTSTRQIFERLLPHIPTGCVVYFDDLYYNFGSRFTGEMRALREINDGAFGDGVELVLDPELSWDFNSVYRFINVDGKSRHTRLDLPTADPVRRRRDDSPFP